LGGSNYHWLNYSEEKLITVRRNAIAAQQGTELHDLAERLIRHKIYLPDDGTTLSVYVNDAIRYNMETEVLLKYSDNAFGTADALLFDGSCLRIHDLKTGVMKSSILQLRIYAAFWCLREFMISPRFTPFDICYVLCIYQNGTVLQENTDPQLIQDIMDKIQRFDYILNQIR
jgi:hypothetical protein